VSALGFEPRTNGLKGQNPVCASYDQEPAIFTLVHWTQNKESLLDAYFKVRVNDNVSSGFFRQLFYFAQSLGFIFGCYSTVLRPKDLVSKRIYAQDALMHFTRTIVLRKSPKTTFGKSSFA
jgi:hypothetical protein